MREGVSEWNLDSAWLWVFQQTRSFTVMTRQDVIHHLGGTQCGGWCFVCEHIHTFLSNQSCDYNGLPRCLFHWSSFNSKGHSVSVGTRASIQMPASETWRLSQGSPPPAAKPRHFWVSKAVLFWGQETLWNGDIYWMTLTFTSHSQEEKLWRQTSTMPGDCGSYSSWLLLTLSSIRLPDRHTVEQE